jgi:hypothetical protein
MVIMSKRIGRCAIILLCGLLIQAGYVHAKDPVQCPPQLQVRQQLDAPVPGWSAAVDKLPNLLAGLTFFDGKPEDNASLAPDRQARQNGKDVVVWNFGTDTSRPVYVACRYAWTTITLQRELPKEVRSCTITYNPRQTIAGLPAIEKIDCK